MNDEENILNSVESLSVVESRKISCSGLPAYDPTVHVDYLTDDDSGTEESNNDQNEDNFLIDVN